METPELDRRGFLRGSLVATAGLTAVVSGLEIAESTPAFAAVRKPTIYSDTAWKAKPPKHPIPLVNGKPTKILIHHTATPNSTTYTKAHAFALARSIQAGHFANGWTDTGQHFTVSRGGIVMEGRHNTLKALGTRTKHVVGAHCPGQNDQLGIENEGNYMHQGLRGPHYTALIHLCAYLCQQYKISARHIYGHRDFFATACPGDVLYKALPKIRRDVAKLL